MDFPEKRRSRSSSPHTQRRSLFRRFSHTKTSFTTFTDAFNERAPLLRPSTPPVIEKYHEDTSHNVMKHKPLTRRGSTSLSTTKTKLKLNYCYCYDCTSLSPVKSTYLPSMNVNPLDLNPKKSEEPIPSTWFQHASFYLAMICIFLVQWGSLVSFVCLGYHYFFHIHFFPNFSSWPLLPVWLYYLCSLELMLSTFAFFHNLQLKTFYNQVQPPTFTREQRWELFTECIHAIHPTSLPTSYETHKAFMKVSRPFTMGKTQTHMVDHIGTFLSAWFFGANPCQIKKQNVKEWFAWAFFNHRLETMDEKGMNELDDMLAWLERETNMYLEPGYTQGIQCIRLNLDSLRYKWFSGLFQALATWLDFMSVVLLRCLGYSSISSPDNSVLLHLPRHFHPKPLLLFHGLGISIAFYFPLMAYLYFQSGRPVIFVRIPSITVRLFYPFQFHPPPSPHILVPFLKKHLQPYTTVTVLSHSLGTTFHSWLTQAFQDHHPTSTPFLRSIYIDPICFGLCWSHTAYHFIYKTPTSSMQLLFRYFGARHPNIAYYLYRHFFWMQSILFPKHCQSPFIVLSEFDFVVHPQNLRRYLNREDMHCLFLKDVGHGGCLYNIKTWPILRSLIEST